MEHTIAAIYMGMQQKKKKITPTNKHSITTAVIYTIQYCKNTQH